MDVAGADIGAQTHGSEAAERVSAPIVGIIVRGEPGSPAYESSRRACAELGQSAELLDALDAPTAAQWIWVIEAGDAPFPDATNAIARAAATAGDAMALMFSAERRGEDGAAWATGGPDARDLPYWLATSPGLRLSAVVWRARPDLRLAAAREFGPMGARFDLAGLCEAGHAVVTPPDAIVRAAPALDSNAGPDIARLRLQRALAVTAAINANGRGARSPHAVLMTTAEVAGGAVAAGVYSEDLLAGFSALPPDRIDDAELAHRFLEGVRAAAPIAPDALASARETLAAEIEHFFDEVIAIGGSPRQVDAARWRVLKRLLGAQARRREDLMITPVDIDVSKPLAPIKATGPQTLLARIHHEGDELDWIQLPTIDGAAAADLRIVLRDALARQPHWRIGQLPGLRKTPHFYGSLALAAARSALDAADAARKGANGRVALSRLRARIIRDAQIASLASMHVKRARRAAFDHAPPLPIGAATTLPILMYHSVTPVEAKASRFMLPLAQFEEQLRWLSANGYRSVDAAGWAAAIRADRPIPDKSVLITFDDAYTDFADHAWPALRRNGFTATLFAPTQFIGRKPGWRDAPRDQQIVDHTTLRALSDDGCEIASHAVSHRRLTSLGPEDMLDEAFDSKRAIEDMIGAPVECVAYPYGDSDAAVRSAFLLGGYQGGFGAWGGLSALGDDPMNIPRIEIVGDQPVEAFIRTMNGHSAALESRCAS